MSDLFKSPRRMLDWGKKRVTELDAAIDAFVKEEPWSYIVEPEATTGRYIHKIVFTERITEDLPNIASDASNNLRSALDQIAFAIASRNTGKAERLSAKFPFGRTEAQVRSDARDGCKDLPSEIVDLFVGFKPYDGGNTDLFTLNKLVNTSKHRMLVPMLVGGAMIVGNRFNPPYQVIHKIWKRESNDIQFMTTDVDCRLETEFNLTISFDNIHPTISGKHPVGVFNAIAREVERVLTSAEAECRRMGLIN